MVLSTRGNFFVPSSKYATYIKTRPNVKFSLYLKKAGLAKRNIVHLQKITLRCVGFCVLYSSSETVHGL